MEISLAFSPCPNDTFIFDALVNGKIDTEGLECNVTLLDVETLNLRAIQTQYDVSKISYGVYHNIATQYMVLDAGSALGTGVGPLLISTSNQSNCKIEAQAIAIPGAHTTAHFLFSAAYPHAVQKLFLRYDEIEDFVLQQKGLGVIIHENRFTYQEKGLSKIIDLGAYWEQQTGCAIPLGGIVIKKSIPQNIQKQINQLLQKSIAYAYEQYPILSEYVKMHAQEMEEDVMRKHIDLYVNDYSKSLGSEGKKAILKMLQIQTGKDFSIEDTFVSIH